jgi:sporulation protein YlmC with PRC-barrel domain
MKSSRGNVEIPLRADVHCIDIENPVGHSQYVVLNPVTEQLTHVVVRDRQRQDVERLVPLELVERATPKRIWLSCTRNEFRDLRPFIGKEFLRTKGSFADYDPDRVLVLPYVVSETGPLPGERKHRSIPPNELAVRRGSRVEAASGPVGTVDEFVIDPVDGGITHLVLRKGHPWGERDVAVPVSVIERVKENVVYLRLSKLRIGLLPTIPVLRKWT